MTTSMSLARTAITLAALALCATSTRASDDAVQAGTPAEQAPTLGSLRLPLVREGSTISRVAGDLTQDPDEKMWLFRPLEPESGGLRREFVLLPCPVLEDMLQTVRVAGAAVQFEATGRVFIYRGRNFLLPDFAPTIMRFDAKPGETPAASDKAQPTPNGEDKFVAPAADPSGKQANDQRDDAAVADIEKRLEERVGRTPQTRANDAKSSSRDGGAGRSEAPIANGTRVTQRLGRLSRDPQSGSWRFVPNQTSGAGDRSVEVLPCLLLEKLEDAAKSADAAPAIQISGIVYAFEGRSYLLPSSFRQARAGRGIGG